jgi:hypothetical protein
MTSSKGIRSNRPLTEFACTHLGLFLTGHYEGSGKRAKGNTTVVYEVEKQLQKLRVFLFGEEILSIVLNNWKVFSICVSFTGFYDHFGRPTTTTSERLNGLLDRLGAYRIITSGTRIFRDPGQDLAYLGRGENKIAVGEEYANSVYIRPGTDELDIVGTLIEHEVA